MIYNLEFNELSKKEWDALDNSIKQLFKKQLEKVLQNPHIPKNRLGKKLNGLYKIKLRKVGYRLAYSVDDQTITVEVIVVGKRDKNLIYKIAESRM